MLRRDNRHVEPGEGFRHRAAGVLLLESRHVKPAQRLRLLDRAIDKLPKKANHRRRKLVLPDELDGVLAVFLGEQHRAHYRAAGGMIERCAIKLHVCHVIELRHVPGAEVVVKFQLIGVLKINRRQVIHQHGELHPLRFLGLLRAGRHPRAAVGRLEFDQKVIVRECYFGFPVGRCAERGWRGLHQLKKPLAGRRPFGEAKRRPRHCCFREPVGQVVGKHERPHLALVNAAGRDGRLTGSLAKSHAQLGRPG